MNFQRSGFDFDMESEQSYGLRYNLLLWCRRIDYRSGHALADEPVKQLFNNKPTTLYSGEKSLQSRILFEICVLDDHARSSSTATSNCDSSRRVPRTVEE